MVRIVTSMIIATLIWACANPSSNDEKQTSSNSTSSISSSSIAVITDLEMFIKDVKSDTTIKFINKELIFNLSGKAIKGPFASGSVSVDGCIDENGLPVIDKIMDASGYTYVVPCIPKTPYVIIKTKGIYFNEVTGENTQQSISLNALIIPSHDSSANANVLTTMIYHAVEKAVRTAPLIVTFDTTKIIDTIVVDTSVQFAIVDSTNPQTQSNEIAYKDTTVSIKKVNIKLNIEADTTVNYSVYDTSITNNLRKVLEVFGLEEYADSIRNPAYESFSTRYKNVLLAVSSTLQGRRSVAEVEVLMNKIGTELRDVGKVSQSTIDEIGSKNSFWDAFDVQTNMKKYGTFNVIPHYQKFIEKYQENVMTIDSVEESDNDIYKTEYKYITKYSTIQTPPYSITATDTLVLYRTIGAINYPAAIDSLFQVKIKYNNNECSDAFQVSYNISYDGSEISMPFPFILNGSTSKNVQFSDSPCSFADYRHLVGNGYQFNIKSGKILLMATLLTKNDYSNKLSQFKFQLIRKQPNKR